MVKTIEVGGITIQQVIEQQEPLFPTFDFFPTLTEELFAEHRSWLEPNYIDPATGQVILCIQSYIVRTKYHNILIDSCVGNHKNLPVRAMWHQMKLDSYEKNFRATGLTFDDIDFVMCTHLHTDHVGWNTRLENGRWVPTFPNAKYVFSDRELKYWTERNQADPDSCPWITESVLPIVDAKMVETVHSNHCLNDHVQLIPSPGHTIDHYSVLVGQSGNDALITGDMVHSPIQARYPEIGMFSDYDSEQAGRSRREIFGRFCDTSTLMCTAHFPSPSTGHVTQWEDGFWIG